MRAVARADFAPWSLSEAVVADFVRKGAYAFDDPLDARACGELLAEIRATRRFDDSLFLDEAEAAAGEGAGPRPARNLLHRLEPKLAFVERAPQVVEAFWTLLGPDYAILDRKVVCALPTDAVPGWVRRRRLTDPARGLGAYVKPQHRDIAYVHGVEPRQDLAERPDRDADFITLHVQLQPAAPAMAPPCLFEGSHRMGAAASPHDLKRTGAESWRYRNGEQGDIYVTERPLAGAPGSAVLWHACTLHAQPPEPTGGARISLRYLVARGTARSTGLDSVNATIAGPLRLSPDAL